VDFPHILRAELVINPAEMADSSIHGMRIGLCFRRSLISASGQLLPKVGCAVGPERADTGHFTRPSMK